MGSVDPDYQCPHCDVVGRGGYALDGVNYPICTSGRANCLNKAVNHGLFSRAAVKQEALTQLVLCVRTNQGSAAYAGVPPCFTPAIIEHIAKCL